jgi:hypothetical protein
MCNRPFILPAPGALVLGLAIAIPWHPGLAEDIDTAKWQTPFLQLCDVACEHLNSPTRKVPFYHDSYAVRGLMVAYDITQKREYLEVSTAWADRMVEYQEKMTPAGAYYMNYNRKPGQTTGQWYVADSASIALGVLATAVRCRDAGDQDRYVRYLRSVESYAQLTIANYVGPKGGITDGLWAKFDGEWWCSSGIFGSLSYVLYAETGQERYRQVAWGAIDWLNQLDIAKAEHISFAEAAPTVLMYVLEAYSTVWPSLEPGSTRQKAAAAQWDFALAWMAQNQSSRGSASQWDYQSQWGSKLGGLPFHMYVLGQFDPRRPEILAAADKELQFVGSAVQQTGTGQLSQLAVFALMSYAEKVRPGAVYRTSRR